MRNTTTPATILGIAALLLLAPAVARAQDCTAVGGMIWETATVACPNACTDGIDNDGDFLVDANAPGCKLELKGKVPGSGTLFDYCADGFDNDDDGYVDRSAIGDTVNGPHGIFKSLGPDPNCSMETNWGAYNACTDGINNDGNVSDNSDLGNTPIPLIDRVPPVGAIGDPNCLGEVLCTDGVDNDGDGLTDAADLDCGCMPDAYHSVCTANDFSIAFTANPQEISDGCINTTDTVTIHSLTATLRSANPERGDLGMWISLSGGSAGASGLCMRQILEPVKYALSVPANTVVQPPGPYKNFEAAVAERDQCGDAGKDTGATWRYPMEVTVPCTDSIVVPNSDGLVDLGQCGSWSQSDKDICNSVTQALPGAPSKCQCQTNDTNIPAPNLHTACSSFSTPTWTVGSGPALDANETVRFELQFTNVVINCTPAGLPISGDPFGRTRCGTVSFMRFEILYNLSGVDASLYGTFYLDNGTTPVPSCAAVSDANVSQSPLPGSGVLCNDTAGKRLIWAPQDPITQSVSVFPAFGVVSPFSGTMSLPFKYTKNTVNAPGTVAMTAKILWDNDLDTDGSGTISVAEAVTVGRFSAEQNSCQDCGCTSSFSTTPVTLTSFSANRESGRVVFDWATATEVGNVGFNILGKTADGWTQLNRDMVATRTADGLTPQDYSLVLDVPAAIEAFSIEDVDVKGAAKRHDAKDLAPEGTEIPGILPIPAAAIQSEHRALKEQREERLRHEAAASIRASVRSGGFQAQAMGAATSSPAIELRVSRDGLYRVTYDDLKAAGFDLAGIQAAKIGLSNRGAEVPIYLSSGRTFGPGGYLEFYGRALDTLYTSENVYRLVVDANKPARAGVDVATPVGTAVPFYIETREFEHNRDYSFASPTGDPWFDARMLVYTTAKEWSFPFSVDGLVDGAAPARLSVHLFGGTDLPQDPDHHVVVVLNGVRLGDYLFNGVADFPISVGLPGGALREGANSLVLRLPADTGAPFDIAHLESWSVRYPRAVSATGDTLTFGGSGDRFDVGGLTSDKVVAYRVTGSTLTKLSGTTVTPSGGAYAAAVRGSATPSTYLVATEAALLEPAIGAAPPYTDITAGSAQYLVITHPDFIDGLAPLVAARQAQGLKVRVVNVEDVYSQFSYGILDPSAIKSYIARAVATQGTEYVLLVGGDSYDYRNYLGVGSLSFIPSIYVATGDLIRFAPSDPAYADLDADGTPDLAIGRLPVRTRAELDTLIGKILAYQAKGYARTAIFAADRGDPSANVPFSAASDTFAAKLPAGWSVRRLYLDQLAVGDARSALIGGIDAGVALTNYVGHSGPAAWTFANLFNVADAAALTNAGRPTVVTQWGCWNTYYVNPQMETLATRLLLAGDRGAAAVLGATTLTEDIDENELGVLLAARIARPGTTIGKAVLDAKKALNGRPASRADVLLGWVLLGDPALVVQP